MRTKTELKCPNIVWIKRCAITAAWIIIDMAPPAYGQWVEQPPILRASDEVNDAQFGSAVAINADVAVVGARNAPSGGFSRGEAYAIRYNGTIWQEEQILRASDEANSAHFGTSVAVLGNLTAIGADSHPSGGTSRGHVYMFRHNGSLWIEEQILQASDEVNSAFFGASVALNADVCLIGASSHASGGFARGQAYVYRYDGATWGEEQILQASDEVDAGQLGSFVAVDGNVALIGAYGPYMAGFPTGKVYVFRHNGTAWLEDQILRASDEEGGAIFGYSVALSGSAALIGAWHHSSGGIQRGQVYVFRDNGVTWQEEQILQASDEINGALFGTSVSLDGDIAVVGAMGHLSGGNQRGQAYVFRFGGATWSQEQVLQASDELDAANFGSSVGVSNYTTLVGARYHPSSGTDRGQAYFYSGPAIAPTPTPFDTRTPTPIPSPSPSPLPTPLPSCTPVLVPPSVTSVGSATVFVGEQFDLPIAAQCPSSLPTCGYCYWSAFLEVTVDDAILEVMSTIGPGIRLRAKVPGISNVEVRYCLYGPGLGCGGPSSGTVTVIVFNAVQDWQFYD